MSDAERLIFSGMQILVGDEWFKDRALVVAGKQILEILPVSQIPNLTGEHYQFTSDYYLIPGLIDLHIHGANGCDVMDGNVQALDSISKALVAEGVTGFLATTMTADRQHMNKVLHTITQAMQSKEGAAILGVHLEGPFIAAEKKGAQCAHVMEAPNVDLFEQLYAASKQKIKLVTLAPELPGIKKLIKALRAKNIIVSVGHTNATWAETQAAIDNGCTHATHLFNAMRGIHQREPGAASALLLSDKVSAELIVDGVHLHPAIVDLSLRLKGNKKMVLITDAMRAKCLGNGEYELGGQKVKVCDGKAMLDDGTLAGSVLTMLSAIKNMMQFSHCTFAEAVNMASRNPANVLGLQNKGSIAPGKDADLVILNPELSVDLTIRNGRVVYQRTDIEVSV